MRIIVDGMGGDNAPQAVVQGAVEAARLIEHEIVLIGDEQTLLAELAANGYRADDPQQGTISVVHASEVILGEDSPVKAVRTKKDSSMVRGIRMLKDGEGDLFISAGNTGALMAGSLFNLGRIPGIDRPAIACIYPIMTQEPALLVDAGANVRFDHLYTTHAAADLAKKSGRFFNGKHGSKIGRVSVFGALQVDDVDMRRAAFYKVRGDIRRVAVYRHLIVVAFIQADRLTFV